MADEKERFFAKLLEAFRVEALDHLDAIAAALLLLEQTDAGDHHGAIERIFREAHTLKGAARTVHASHVEGACHEIETLFANLKGGKASLTPGLLDSLHSTIASLRASVGGQGQTPHRGTTVRLPVPKLDALMHHADELVAAKLAAAQRVRELAEVRGLDPRVQTIHRNAESDLRLLASSIDSLLADIKSAQLLPFSSIADAFPSTVRQIARAQGKEIDLRITGREVELGRRMLEEIKGPLLHLLRNCIDHGIEKPDARRQAGKPPAGHIAIHAAHRGSRVEITIADDGAGIDRDSVILHAERLGLTPADPLSLIFQSGLSTSPVVTEISGRGVGLSVVRENVEQLGGRVSVASERSRGTTITLSVPVTLTTLRGVFVDSGHGRFVIPTTGVECVTRVAAADLRDGFETTAIDGRIVRFVHLTDVLGLPRATNGARFIHVFVLGSDSSRTAFGVREVLAEQEIVVKSLGPQLARVRNLAGATVLGTGDIIPVLSSGDLLESAASATAARQAPLVAAEAKTPASILVVEDSITSRMLLKNILESAGYEVAVAVDGADAWAALRSRTFDLVVSDVEMPRMDGFELTARIRDDQLLAATPVILVTALDSREMRERGLDAGARAYIVKSQFNQSDLLEAVKRLLE